MGAALLVALALAGCTTEDVGPAGDASSAASAPAAPSSPAAPAAHAAATTQPPAGPAAQSPVAQSPTPAAVEVGETFTMPGVVGMNLQTAQDTLQALGSFLMDQQDGGGLSRLQLVDSNWKVCRQDPATGAVVPVETVVTLGAVKLDERCP